MAAHPGIAIVLIAKDVPGIDCYGVIPRFADQPVFAHDEARYRGEGVAAIVGETEVSRRLIFGSSRSHGRNCPQSRP